MEKEFRIPHFGRIQPVTFCRTTAPSNFQAILETDYLPDAKAPMRGGNSVVVRWHMQSDREVTATVYFLKAEWLFK